MAQILDLSTRFTKEQIEAAAQTSSSFEDLPAGGYICKIVRPILNDDPASGKANIELQVDIAEGEFAGYFQRLEDRYGFWGLRGWLSFKTVDSANRFMAQCVAICADNPGLEFNPFLKGGADVDTLAGKKIGVVTQKEEYRNSSGDIREKDSVFRFVEVQKIKSGKFKVPPLKKLKESASESSFRPVSTTEEIPY